MSLHIAPGLSLPTDFAGKRAAIVARSGGGKTYTASVLAEEMVAAGQPFYALDPTGAWWGLRASADRKKDGLPVIVIGGEHGDLPLDESGGAAIADLVAHEPSFYVLDLSGLGTRAAEVRFATAFLDRLYRAKAKRRDTLHGFWDEADLFAPQRSGPDEARMLGAAEQLVRRGRIRGLGTTLISQRPAVVNKNVLSQIDVLIALKIGDPRDRAAIKDWLDGTPDPDHRREVLDSLASLGLGEAWIYAPGETPPIYKRAKVRERRTFNSSAAGDGGAEPARLAAVDVDALRERLAATIEKAKQDDPRELRRQVADLRKELAAAEKRQTPTPAPEPTIEYVDRPVLADEQVDALREIAAALGAHASAIGAAAGDVLSRLDKLATGRPTPPRPAPTPRAGRPHAAAPRPARESAPGDFQASTSQQRILDALAMLEAIGLPSADKTQLALFAGTKPTSGGYKNNLGALRNQAAYIEYPTAGTVALTDAGRAVADGTAAPQTTEELHDLVRGLVPAAQWALVDTLIGVYPDALTREDLAARVGVPETSGGFKNNLGRLRSLGLIDYPTQGYVAALPVLFLEDAP